MAQRLQNKVGEGIGRVEEPEVELPVEVVREAVEEVVAGGSSIRLLIRV